MLKLISVCRGDFAKITLPSDQIAISPSNFACVGLSPIKATGPTRRRDFEIDLSDVRLLFLKFKRPKAANRFRANYRTLSERCFFNDVEGACLSTSEGLNNLYLANTVSAVRVVPETDFSEKVTRG